MRTLLLLSTCLLLQGCVIAGVQWRHVNNDQGELVKQIRPCLYFVICTPWGNPNDAPLAKDEVKPVYEYPHAK